ncbi:putative accessory gene regulator protein [uncultured Clostridium sp.]|nr:putative accessory gene regulator protein [uncultured Clostridium sp.]SCJ13828.1 putative accessory gene regulator protein [uncultured Clostridium sp.]
MSMIENVSNSIATKIGEKANKSKDEIEVMNYGLFICLHTIVAFIITIIIGILIGRLKEMLIITLVASSLKRCSGGVHATSPNRCLIIGLIFSVILTYTCGIFNIYGDSLFIYLFSLIIIAFCYYIFYKKAPVGTKNKPLKKESTRKKLRKKVFRLLNLYIVIIILCILVGQNEFIKYNLTSFIYCIELGIILQTISLTKLGEAIILKIDCFLK